MRHRIHQGGKGAGQTTLSRETSLDRSSSFERASGNAGSGSWGITSDDAGETSSAIPNPVPMFNPLHYSSYKKDFDVPPAPGSLPLLWQHQNDQSASPLEASTTTSGVSVPRAPSSYTGLRTSQLPSLTPTLVPDSKYRAYLMGQPWKAKTKPIITKVCAAKFCLVFSWIAVMFLVFIGILLDRQPIFIPKVLPKHTQFSTGDRKPKTFYTVLLSERLVPASNAYSAAGCYMLTGIISYAYLHNFWGYFNTWRRRRMYQDIPDTDSTVPTFHYPRLGLDEELPTYSNNVGSPVMRAYQYNNRLSRRIWEYISLTTHRIGIFLATVWPRYQDKRRARRRYTEAKDI